jgi:hypothetical protein
MHIEAETYSADIEWDKTGKPVLYVVGRGRITVPKQALDAVTAAVKMIDEGPFAHVCSVYNVLDITQLPFLGRFVTSGRVSTSPKTAHIILGTTLPAIQLIASLIAVASAKRLRTLAVCKNQQEIDAAVKSWLSLPDITREYTVDNI